MSPLLERIRQSLLGARQAIDTPFGPRPLIYADYTASGRALGFIEDYIREQVLPCYANTHSETAYTGASTTRLREQARAEIRKAVNAGADHRVIFCGSGATAAVHRLVDALGLRLPSDPALRSEVLAGLPEKRRPVVFVGPYEHHSNELPWRESLAEVVRVPLDAAGGIDQTALAQALQRYRDRPLRVGSFSAASNVTGIRSDVAGISALLRAHGALVCWDYAAGGPYLPIDVQGGAGIDAVFLSPHKFVGGPGTPGVLVARAPLLDYPVPAISGGGTVAWVSPGGHRYVDDRERREEGGTPGIVESIRAGLVFKLRDEVGTDTIGDLERSFIQRALARLDGNPHLEIVGGTRAERLAILSLRFFCDRRELHHGYVVSLLNDLFGIQARGGCSCAGPYGHDLLGLDSATSEALDLALQGGHGILRPGWVRLGFNYFIDEEEFEYLLSALELIAEHGWRLLPWYRYCTQQGIWYRQTQRTIARPSISGWRFADGSPGPDRGATPPSLKATLSAARDALLRPGVPPTVTDPWLPPALAALRGFLLPGEAVARLQAERAA